LSPHTPLLFMGQEWNASAPFCYFTDHEPALGRLVAEGRRREFAEFEGFHGQLVPDPQAIETFQRSILDWSEPLHGEHARMLGWYRALIGLRRRHPAWSAAERARPEVRSGGE